MKKIIVFLFLVAIFLTGCNTVPKPDVIQDINQPIGGQRDEHGCLGPAGYSWNEEANACIREWELDESQRKAANIAVDHVGYQHATTIVSVDVARCPGCFSVRLEQGEKRIPHIITLNGWKATNTPKTDTGCEESGGTWLPEHNECEYTGKQWCDEKDGEWKECESACRHDPEAEMCTMQCVPVCQF